MEKINKELLKKYGFDFPESMVPRNIQALINMLYDEDNRKVARNARKAEDMKGFSYGLIQAVKKAIQTYNKVQNGPAKTAEDARVNRIQFEHTSDGKKSRKW